MQLAKCQYLLHLPLDRSSVQSPMRGHLASTWDPQSNEAGAVGEGRARRWGRWWLKILTKIPADPPLLQLIHRWSLQPLKEKATPRMTCLYRCLDTVTLVPPLCVTGVFAWPWFLPFSWLLIPALRRQALAPCQASSRWKCASDYPTS